MRLAAAGLHASRARNGSLFAFSEACGSQHVPQRMAWIPAADAADVVPGTGVFVFTERSGTTRMLFRVHCPPEELA